jgi:phosphopantetheinyl transferase (holo-ACP synthase)
VAALTKHRLFDIVPVAQDAAFETLRDGLVVLDPLGCPSLELSGRAVELMTALGATKTHLSYSHDGEYAVATVILED